MKRSAFKPQATIQAKTCAWCREDFFPARPMQKVCGPICGLNVARKKREKVEAAEHREKLAESKPLAHWLDLTQRVVNSYIQARDAGRPCISCGTTNSREWDAGHFLSRGARPELRFDPANIALQCASCNRHKGGNQAQFRAGLIERIGLAAVESLEGPHPAAKFTRESLAAIRKDFSAKARQLKKERA